MEAFKEELAQIIGKSKNVEVKMDSKDCIIVKYSEGNHWLRIYPSSQKDSDDVYVISDHGFHNANAQSKITVLKFFSQMFT